LHPPGRIARPLIMVSEESWHRSWRAQHFQSSRSIGKASVLLAFTYRCRLLFGQKHNLYGSFEGIDGSVHSCCMFEQRSQGWYCNRSRHDSAAPEWPMCSTHHPRTWHLRCPQYAGFWSSASQPTAIQLQQDTQNQAVSGRLLGERLPLAHTNFRSFCTASYPGT
jgi:hypothetical protein